MKSSTVLQFAGKNDYCYENSGIQGLDNCVSSLLCRVSCGIHGSQSELEMPMSRHVYLPAFEPSHWSSTFYIQNSLFSL